MVFQSSDLYECWSYDLKIILNGIKYRVGKMNYGDYFLEPGIALGETHPFNSGTLWLAKDETDPNLYEVDYAL